LSPLHARRQCAAPIRLARSRARSGRHRCSDSAAFAGGLFLARVELAPQFSGNSATSCGVVRSALRAGRRLVSFGPPHTMDEKEPQRAGTLRGPRAVEP